MLFRSRGAVVVTVRGESTSEAEEGGSEFHGRWSASWIGDGRCCFGGTGSHTISSCERNIHPSIDARNPRNSPPLVILDSSGGSSHFFCFNVQNNGNPVALGSAPALLLRLFAPIDS